MPSTLVILPDTQNYPKAYPDILTRQAEWIAANAESLNIGAVLHVGDIVDNNEPGQWERAARRLHVLDGVVPYVLAVGNHDVRISYTQERSLFNRDGSLINNYFTVEDARRYSGLGGTFAPGRLENSYSVFSLGGTPYIVFALEWGPRGRCSHGPMWYCPPIPITRRYSLLTPLPPRTEGGLHRTAFSCRCPHPETSCRNLQP